MLNFLKFHAGAVTALVGSIIFATVLVGCQVKTSSIENPGAQVTQETLNQEIVRAQQRLDNEAADLQSKADAVATAQQKYLADVKATQGAIDNSKQEAQRKVDQRTALISAIPSTVMSVAGQVAAGHLDVMSILGSLLASISPVVAVGATVDVARSRLQVQQLTKPWDGVDRRGDTATADASASAQTAANPPSPTKLAA